MDEKLIQRKIYNLKSRTFNELVSYINNLLNQLQQSECFKHIDDSDLILVQDDDLFRNLMEIIEDKNFTKYAQRINEVTKKKERSKLKELNPPYYDFVKERKKISKRIKYLNAKLEEFNDDFSKKDLIYVYKYLKQNSVANIILEDYISTDKDDNKLFIKQIETRESFFNKSISFEFIEINPKYKSSPKLHNQYKNFKLLYESTVTKVSKIITQDLKILQKQFVYVDKMAKDLEKSRTNLNETDIKEINRNSRVFVENELNQIEKKEIEKRRTIAVDLRSRRKKIFENNFEILPFEIFPKGNLSISRIIKRLKEEGIKISVYDERRLYKIDERFPNSEICLGRDKFKGYVVFRFKNKEVVIVEKPAYGNATYIIKGNWEKDVLKILQLSKGEAMLNYPTKVRRVIHTTEYLWLAKLELKFKYWY